MSKNLLTELEKLMTETGLSAHRIGIICAKNGRIIERLRAGKRVWPDTEAEVLGAIKCERARRSKGTTSKIKRTASVTQ